MFWDEHEDKMQRRADILFPTMKDKKEKENIKKTIGLGVSRFDINKEDNENLTNSKKHNNGEWAEILAEHIKNQQKEKKREDILYPTMKDKKEIIKEEPNIEQIKINKKDIGYVTGGAANIDNSNTVKTVDNTVFSDKALKKTRSYIKNAEGCNLNAYKDTKGIWTIGYGHTGKVDGKEITAGMKITQEKAEELYREDVREHALPLKDIKIPLSDNEKVALTSFIYNIGGPEFRRSTTYKKLLIGDKKGAADAMLKYCKETQTKNINGKPVKQKIFRQGLYNRRVRERNLFLTPDEE